MRRCWTVWLLITAGLLRLGAADGVRHRNITMDDGLASNTVRNIVQDPYGFVWFGTDNGLCRYDGTQVRLFRIAELGLNQYVSALLATEQGLYVGTEQGVYCLSGGEGAAFLKLDMDISTTVTHLSTDKDGALWVSTFGQGVWQYEPSTGQTHHYDFKESGGAVSQVFVDNDNRVWTVTNWGLPVLERLNRLHNRFEPVDVKYDGNLHALCMTQTRDGRLWIGTWEDGLLLLHSDGRAEQVHSPVLTKVGTHIHTLVERSDDCICMGCDDGVVCLDPRTRSWHPLHELPNSETATMPLGDRFVYSIMNDREGGLWTGTFYGGVNYLSPVDKRFEGFTADGSDASLPAHVISRFCEDSMGRVWMASDDGGLVCYLPAEHRFADYPHRSELAAMNVHALCMDSEDRLWVGTYTDGVLVMDLHSGELRRYTQTSGDSGLDGSSSYAIYHDRQQQTWVATMDGLNRYDAEKDAFEHIGKTGVLTIDIDEDRNGRLWLSTQGGGLWRYDPKRKVLHPYRHDEQDERSLPHNQVNCATMDESGRLWVGTQGGLCHYDAENDCFVRIGLNVPNQNIMGIVEDHGVLWLSTERGIVKYEPRTTPSKQSQGEGVTRFTRQDGLVSEQFQPNAGMKASDGQIYFGTTNGFNVFFPYRIKTNSVMPPVYITAVALFNEEATTAEGLPLDLSRQQELELDYQDGRMLTLSFASLSYYAPEKNQYAYRLEGFDKEWNYVGNQTRATYTNLPAGTYTFRVKATNNDGIWSENEAQLRIVVRPPLWWSWWAKLLYLLLMAGGIYWYVHERLKLAEHRHQQEMKRLSEEKEKEVREARLNFFTMIAHEIRTPVSLIIGPLEKLMKKGNPSDDMRIIDRNAHRLLELVNQLLDFRKVEQQRLVMHFAPQNVRELLMAVCERFEPSFETGGVDFNVNYPDEHFTAMLDREAVTKVVSNLLTNARKYTKSRADLHCMVLPDGEHFSIAVADDGAGISPDDQQRIFEPFFQAQSGKPGTGIGLNIVKNIVEQHHGRISVESVVGQGSTFTVVLPVSQESTENAPISMADGPVTTAQDPASATETATTEATTRKTETPVMLIVDDSEDMVGFLASNFANHYEVLTAGDGIEALHQLQKHQVSIIVSDWMMPRMDGAALCREVRRNPATSHIPFVMLTAKTDDGSKVKGMDVGADIYVEKPFSMEFLEACIRNMLTIRRRLIEKFSTQPGMPATEIAGNQTDNEFLARMTKIIEENISNTDLSVVFLAEQLGISRSGLFAKIRTLADLTPNEMIQVIRLKRAAQLLREGRYLISEVGYKVGFSNPSYFSKCFYKQFGIKPADFVNSTKGKATPT